MTPDRVVLLPIIGSERERVIVRSFMLSGDLLRRTLVPRPREINP